MTKSDNKILANVECQGRMQIALLVKASHHGFVFEKNGDEC